MYDFNITPIVKILESQIVFLNLLGKMNYSVMTKTIKASLLPMNIFRNW